MSVIASKFNDIIHQVAIIGDIGGTNARFALVAPNGITHSMQYKCADFESFHDLLDRYYADIRGAGTLSQEPIAISLGIAGPVKNGKVHMSNLGWDLDCEALESRYGVQHAIFMNDFVAVAKSIEHLNKDDFALVGKSSTQNNPPVEEGVISVIGPGTGLGYAIITPTEEGNVISPKEIEFNDLFRSRDKVENSIIEIVEDMTKIEVRNTLIRGQGLLDIYNAFCISDDVPAVCPLPENVSYAARGGDKTAQKAFGMFCSLLGRTAGNMAANDIATKVCIAGGIIPKMLPEFQQSAYLQNFRGKGPQNASDKIDSAVVMCDLPAMVGAEKAVRPYLRY